MTNVNDLQSMERFIDKKIEPLNKQISMLQIELNSVKQQLTIPVVSNQRELLKAFCDWAYNKNEDWNVSDYDIDKYLKSL